MARVLLLGVGTQGRAIAYDLAADHDLLVADTDPKRLVAAAAWLTNLHHGAAADFRVLDAASPASWPPQGPLDGVVNAASYTLATGLADWVCAQGRLAYVDLGGNPEVVASLHHRHNAAVTAKATLVPDAGLAPGLAQLLAAHGLAKVPKAHSVSILCGGLPPTPGDHPWRHALFFAAEGLLNEYRGEETILQDGELAAVPCLGGVEEVEIAGVGTLEAAHTRGGMSTAAATFLGHLKNYSYKTLRWPGHWEYVAPWREGLLAGDWQRDPHRALAEQLGGEVPTSTEDMVVLRVTVEGDSGRWECTLVDKSDPATGLSAMARTTGFPAAEVMRQACRGKLPKGVLRHEADLPAAEILNALERKGLAFAVEAS